MRSVGTVNVQKVRTLIYLFIFSAVRNFRNYVSEIVLIFEILECGLYHEKKRYICISKCGRNVLKTRRYDSVKCPARAVFAKSRARHVHVMSLNLLTNRKSSLI